MSLGLFLFFLFNLINYRFKGQNFESYYHAATVIENQTSNKKLPNDIKRASTIDKYNKDEHNEDIPNQEDTPIKKRDGSMGDYDSSPQKNISYDIHSVEMSDIKNRTKGNSENNQKFDSGDKNMKNPKLSEEFNYSSEIDLNDNVAHRIMSADSINELDDHVKDLSKQISG